MKAKILDKSSDSSQGNDSSKIIVKSSSDTDDDTCEDLDDRDSEAESQLIKNDLSMEKLEQEDIIEGSNNPSNDDISFPKNSSSNATPTNMNGIAGSCNTSNPKLTFSNVVDMKPDIEPIRANHVTTRFSVPNTIDAQTRPIIDVDVARIRAEKVVAAVFAEAKEVAEAAAKADADSKSKTTQSDSEESPIETQLRDEIDTEMVCVDDSKGRKCSISEDSSDDSSGTYSPSSSSDADSNKAPGILTEMLKKQSLSRTSSDSAQQPENTNVSAKTENNKPENDKLTDICEDRSTSDKTISGAKEQDTEVDIDLNDPEVEKVAAKLQSGFFSKFGKREEPKPKQEQTGVLSSITSFMSSPSKTEPSQAMPKDTSKTKISNVSDKDLKNVAGNTSVYKPETLDATKHGTHTENIKKMEEEEEEMPDLNDPDVKKVTSKLQAGFFSRLGRKNVPSSVVKPVSSQATEIIKEGGNQQVPAPEKNKESTSIVNALSSVSENKTADTTISSKNVDMLKRNLPSTASSTTNNSKIVTDEDEVDIDLNDPAVGKVATQLQAGFFSRFGKKTEDNSAQKIVDSSKDVSKSSTPLVTKSVTAVTPPIKKEEEEIDIDLNDPAVGKVAAQLQTGFFSKFGKKAVGSNNAAPVKVQTDTKALAIPKIQAASKDESKNKANLVAKPVTTVDTSNKKVEEEEIDIDLNDPEVGKVAEKLQAGFFSRFGKKKEETKKPTENIARMFSPKPFVGNNISQNISSVNPVKDKVPGQTQARASTAKVMFSEDTHGYVGVTDEHGKPSSVLSKEGKEALTSLAEKTKWFSDDINEPTPSTQKYLPSTLTNKEEVTNPNVAKNIPKPSPRKKVYGVHSTEEQKKMNAELKVKHAQFCYSSSSPSDEEIKTPLDLTKQQIVEQRKKQLGVSLANATMNSTTPKQKPPRTSHGRVTKVDKVTKLYTGSPVNAGDSLHSSVKRWSQPSFDGYEKSTASKNIKNITQMYSQAIAEASTPPCSPKPGPASKVRKNVVAQIYTSNVSSASSTPYLSPCISADNLSPRKVKDVHIQ